MPLQGQAGAVACIRRTENPYSILICPTDKSLQIKQLLEIFLNRTEQLGSGQSKAYHKEQARLASNEIEEAKASPQGLFKGCFNSKDYVGRINYDDSDHTYRCTNCHFEVLPGAEECINCGFDFEGENDEMTRHTHGWSDDDEDLDIDSDVDAWDDNEAELYEGDELMDGEFNYDSDHTGRSYHWSHPHHTHRRHIFDEEAEEEERFRQQDLVSLNSDDEEPESDAETVTSSMMDFIDDNDGGNARPITIHSDGSDNGVEDSDVDVEDTSSPVAERSVSRFNRHDAGHGWSPLQASEEDTGDEEEEQVDNSGEYPSESESDNTLGRHSEKEGDEEDEDSDNEGGVSASRPMAPEPPRRPWERARRSHHASGMTLVDRGGHRNKRRIVIESSDEDDQEEDQEEEDGENGTGAGAGDSDESDGQEESDEGEDSDDVADNVDSDIEMASEELSSPPPQPTRTARRRNYKAIREQPEELGQAHNMRDHDEDSSDEDVRPQPRRRRLFHGEHAGASSRTLAWRSLERPARSQRTMSQHRSPYMEAEPLISPQRQHMRVLYAPRAPSPGFSAYAMAAGNYLPSSESPTSTRSRLRRRFQTNY